MDTQRGNRTALWVIAGLLAAILVVVVVSSDLFQAAAWDQMTRLDDPVTVTAP